jgi:hypothetical protein
MHAPRNRRAPIFFGEAVAHSHQRLQSGAWILSFCSKR